jgi:hypothetical protein
LHSFRKSVEVAFAAIEFGSVEYLLKSHVTEELVRDIVSNFHLL